MALDLQPGDIFERDYCVVGPLSEGGMGSLYVVEQTSTGKRRALKLMLSSAGNDDTARRRFAQEARVGALIESEHIVEVIAAGVEAKSNTPWLVMELLEGEDLGSFLEREGVMSPAATRLVFDQLCHGLSAAHSIPIVHRDLKPENVFLARSRVARTRFLLKILDFGIAKVLVQGAKTTGSMGTPLWMAPEQAGARAQITPAADVWALGLIAFRMLTGKYFWREANVEDGGGAPLMREILVDDIPIASARSAEVFGATLPPGFDEWFAKCVDRDPTKRFPDAKAAWEALDPLLEVDAEASVVVQAPAITRMSTGAGTPARAPVSGFEPTVSNEPVTATQPPRGKKPTPVVLGIAALAFVVAVGVGATLWLRKEPPASASPALPASSTAVPVVVASTAAPPTLPAIAASTVTTAVPSVTAASPHHGLPSAGAHKDGAPAASSAAPPPKPTGGNPLKMDLQ